MTTHTDPITNAVRLLHESADNMQQAYDLLTKLGYQNAAEALDARQQRLAAAQALQDFAESLGAGGVQPLRLLAAHATTATPPPSNTLWRFLTNGYSHEFVNQLADANPDKRTLMHRATKNWQQICSEVAHKSEAPSKQAAPLAIKMIGYGGCTGINDYLMSDGTIKAMRPRQVVWREKPQHEDRAEPLANDIHGALTAAAIYLTNAQRRYEKEMHRGAIAALEQAQRAVAQAADFAKAAPQPPSLAPLADVLARVDACAGPGSAVRLALEREFGQPAA